MSDTDGNEEGETGDHGGDTSVTDEGSTGDMESGSAEVNSGSAKENDNSEESDGAPPTGDSIESDGESGADHNSSAEQEPSSTRRVANERRAAATRRYEQAADRGKSKRKRRRRRAAREDPISGVSRSLQRLPLQTALETTLVLATIGSVLALGSVHPPVMAIVGLLSATALGLALMTRTEKSASLIGPAAVCWMLAAWSALQMVPLPMSWLEAIAPTNADIWQRALIPFGEASPSSAPISLDPGGRAMEALRWFSYGAIFVAASQVATHRGARWVLTLVFVTAMVTALVTLGHGLTSMRKVYGFYQPTFRPSQWHIGPLLNPNNLAGLLNLGAMCGLGLVLTESKTVSPWLIVMGVALIVGVGVISASRGGVALLLIGIVVLAVLVELPSRRARETPTGRARLMVGTTLALGVVLALLGGRSELWDELLDKNAEKLRLVGDVEPAVLDFPYVGMGRGAFESVFPAYQPARGDVVYTHAENFVAQWSVEWGLPITVLAVLALGFFLRPRRMGIRQSSLAASAWLGVLLVLLQNLLDLGLEIPGLCMALAATLGALWGDPDLFREKRVPRVSARRRLVVTAAAVAVGVVVSVGGFALGRHTVAAERRALREQLIGSKPPRSAAQVEAMRSNLRAAMKRHPAEPYFALLGAELAWEERGEAIPWLQRVLERSAVNGKAHLLLARVLWRHGHRHQALLELKLAVQSERSLLAHAAGQATKWTTDLKDLERVVPSDEHAAAYWDLIGHLIQDRAIAAECDRRSVELDPTRVGPRVRLVDDLVAARRSEKACTGDDLPRCAAEIEEHANVADREQADTSSGIRMRALWLAATGKAAEGEQLLAAQCETKKDATDCLMARATIAFDIEGTEPFAEAATALRRSGCAERGRCGAINVWLGDKHMARKEHASAVTAFEKAVRENPKPEWLKRLARAATAAGLSSRAARALERLIEKTPDPAEKAKLKQQRREVMRRMLR